MSSAPEPVLGFDNNNTMDARERRLYGTSRVALGFSICGVVIPIAVVGLIRFVAGMDASPEMRRGVVAVAGFLSVMTIVSLVLGTGLGIHAWKFRNGKVAFFVGLIPLLLQGFFFAVRAQIRAPHP